MKKIEKMFAICMLVLCLSIFASCSIIKKEQIDEEPEYTDNQQYNSSEGSDIENTNQEGKKYKLTVIDNYNYLANDLEEYYAEGEKIEIHIVFLSGPRGGINLNGKNITDFSYSDSSLPVYTFTMPAMDSVVYTTMNGYTGNREIDCQNGYHSWDEGILVVVPMGGEEKIYKCEFCDKNKTSHLKDTTVATFDELFHSSNIFDTENISSMTIDSDMLILDSLTMHNVATTDNEKLINSIKEFIKNAYFVIAEEYTLDPPMNKITVFAGEKSLEIGMSNSNQFLVDGVWYNSSMEFPLRGYYNNNYYYIEPKEDVLITSYGITTTLTDFDISEIHLHMVEISKIAEDVTKDADLTIGSEKIKINSASQIDWGRHGYWTVVSEKDFSSIIPERETMSWISFVDHNTNTKLMNIIVSNNVIYTSEEIRELLKNVSHIIGESYDILNSDGSSYADRVFTADEILTIKYETQE